MFQLILCMVFPPAIYFVLKYRNQDEIEAQEARRKKMKQKVRYNSGAPILYYFTSMVAGVCLDTSPTRVI